MTTTKSRIMALWQWCCDGYGQHGHRLSFPKNTDPAKTYQWRYLQKLHDKLEAWGLDDQQSKLFIDTAINYASDCKLTSKGLSIFCQNNILQICYDRMRQESTALNNAIAALENERGWLIDQCRGRPELATLMMRSTLGANYNIIRWHRTNNLSELYLALSLSATQAIARIANISPADRLLLPKATRLFLVRSSFLKNNNVTNRTKAIFGDDWRQM